MADSEAMMRGAVLRTQRYGSFPPAEFIPDAVKPHVDHLLNLRSKFADAREDEATKKRAIDEVEAASVKATADALARGEDAKIDDRKIQQAQRDHTNAVRQVLATSDALAKAELAVDTAYAQHNDQAVSVADNAVETARDEYREAFKALVAKRRTFHLAQHAKRFTDSATAAGPERPVVVHYNPVNIEEPREFNAIRHEIDPPVIPVNTIPGSSFIGV